MGVFIGSLNQTWDAKPSRPGIPVTLDTAWKVQDKEIAERIANEVYKLILNMKCARMALEKGDDFGG